MAYITGRDGAFDASHKRMTQLCERSPPLLGQLQYKSTLSFFWSPDIGHRVIQLEGRPRISPYINPRLSFLSKFKLDGAPLIPSPSFLFPESAMKH